MGENEQLTCQSPHTPKLKIELPCHLAALPMGLYASIMKTVCPQKI